MDKATFRISKTTLERARNAVVALSGPPFRLTLTGLLEAALVEELDRLELAHNQAMPFPPRNGGLARGRRIG